MSLKLHIIHSNSPERLLQFSSGKDLGITLEKIESTIVNKHVEHLVLINKHGGIIKQEVGQRDRCESSMLFSTFEDVKYRGDMIATHNHPDAEDCIVPCLSPQDIYSASSLNLKEIRAVSQKTRLVYSITRPESGWWPMDDETNKKILLGCYTAHTSRLDFNDKSDRYKVLCIAVSLGMEMGYAMKTVQIGNTRSKKEEENESL